MAPVVVDTDLLMDFLRGYASGAEVVQDWISSGRLRFAMPLATRNVRHFERVEGLALVDLTG